MDARGIGFVSSASLVLLTLAAAVQWYAWLDGDGIGDGDWDGWATVTASAMERAAAERALTLVSASTRWDNGSRGKAPSRSQSVAATAAPPACQLREREP